jgi:hypothetical protein
MMPEKGNKFSVFPPNGVSGLRMIESFSSSLIGDGTDRLNALLGEMCSARHRCSILGRSGFAFEKRAFQGVERAQPGVEVGARRRLQDDSIPRVPVRRIFLQPWALYTICRAINQASCRLASSAKSPPSFISSA